MFALAAFLMVFKCQEKQKKSTYLSTTALLCRLKCLLLRVGQGYFWGPAWFHGRCQHFPSYTETRH